jgi:polar amino acid transport system substrate-binding protein
MNWKVRCAAGLLLAAAALTCTPARAAQPEVVTVGAEDDWFPYSGLVNGEVQGITLDVVRAAFAATGITVKFEVMPYARCMALTKAGQLLACFDTLRHPGIESDYLWHDPPMFKVQYRIYAPADSTEQNLRPADLEGRRVAVTHAYEYGAEFDTNPKIVRVFSLRDESNFGMVLRGRAEYTLALDINTRLLMKRHPELVGRFKIVGAVSESGVYTVFSRRYPDSRRLMARFEQGLRAVVRSGRVQQIQDDWFSRLTRPSR